MYTEKFIKTYKGYKIFEVEGIYVVFDPDTCTPREFDFYTEAINYIDNHPKGDE